MTSSIHSLKTLSKQVDPVQVSLHITERLPYFIQGACTVFCEISVQREHRYYKLNLKSKSEVTINCQRCLQDFLYSYNQIHELAVCENEEIATQMMSSMDCIVQTTDDLDLVEIVTDDLHLFIPEKHETCEKHLEYFQKDCKILPHQ